MDTYRQDSHTRYSLKIHLVFVTKYRKQVLQGDVAHRLRTLIREICLANDIQIIKGHVSKDHVHLLLSYPPRLSVSKIAQYIKGKSSRKMLQEYSDLRRKFWGQHLWARGYFAVSTGNITDKVGSIPLSVSRVKLNINLGSSLGENVSTCLEHFC